MPTFDFPSFLHLNAIRKCVRRLMCQRNECIDDRRLNTVLAHICSLPCLIKLAWLGTQCKSIWFMCDRKTWIWNRFGFGIRENGTKRRKICFRVRPTKSLTSLSPRWVFGQPFNDFFNQVNIVIQWRKSANVNFFSRWERTIFPLVNKNFTNFLVNKTVSVSGNNEKSTSSINKMLLFLHSLYVLHGKELA